jgi:hypothetical protein
MVLAITTPSNLTNYHYDFLPFQFQLHYQHDGVRMLETS